MKIQKNNLNEKKLMHWGNLDYGRKADRRQIMSGRGTGHFGTGFYFVSEDKYGDMHFDYEKSRPIYEIDTSDYNLYSPKTNSDAYKLHDNLKILNQVYSKDDLISKDKIQMIEDGMEEIDEKYFNSEISETDMTDLYATLLNKVDPDERYYNSYDLEDWIKNNYAGRIEKVLLDMKDDLKNWDNKLNRGIDYLSFLFNVSPEQIKSVIEKALNQTDAEDSISTEFMKSLGYEGIDVSSLNVDAQGLSGPDNFSYGSVIYDLKPGTYKRIKEPREIPNKG